MQQGNGLWDDATLPPNLDVSLNGSTPILFRYAMTWDTTEVPLGSNGDHELAAAPKLWFQEWEVGEGELNLLGAIEVRELAVDVRYGPE